MGKRTVRFVTLELSGLWLYMRYRHFFYQSLWWNIQSGILNCNSPQNVVYLLKCRICGEAGKAKTKFRARFNNYKGAHRSYRQTRKVSQQHLHEHFGQHSHNEIDDWQFTLMEQCETHEQLKEREIFW